MDVQTAIMLFVALLMLAGKIIFNYDNLENFEPYRNWFFEKCSVLYNPKLRMASICGLRTVGHPAEP